MASRDRQAGGAQQRYAAGSPPLGARSGPANSSSPLGISMDELEKLDKMMVVVAAIGMVVNITQLFAINNHAWIKATALHEGQPFTAFLSLDGVRFGVADDPSRDNQVFCTDSHECRLRELCSGPVNHDAYERTGLRMNTAPEAWCGFNAAGTFTTKLLSVGLLLGLIATGITGMYASQSIPWVATQFDKIEELGFSDRIQKYIMCSCWVALWGFVFSSMATYALLIPDTLGWGAVKLEASFGLLRLCFVLCTINGALVINSLFELWDPSAARDVWQDFASAKLLSARKCLYVLLFIQTICYLLMVVAEVDWSSLLIVIAAVYLTADDQTFMVIYITLVVISILFDIIRAAELPAFDQMTSGEQYGNVLWLTVFALKPVVLVTIIAHEKFTRAEEASHWAKFDEESRTGEHEVAE